MERRLLRIFLSLVMLIVLLVVIGWIGFMLIEHLPWHEALSATINILSQVGLGEMPAKSMAGLFLVGFLQFGSIAVVVVAVGNLSQMIIEGALKQYLGRFRMDERINKLSNHSIVIGFSLTGSALLKDLTAEGQQFVVVERDPDKITKLEEKGYLYVEGDALDENILRKAGIERARALFAVLSNDSDNLMVVLSARGMNPNITIVSKSTREEYLARFLRAGANSAISPQEWASRRMVQAVLRPRLLELLSSLLDPEVSHAYMDEITVTCNSPVIGRTLGDSKIRQASSIFILGISRPTGETIMAPGKDEVLGEGDVLIGFGERNNFKKLAAFIDGSCPAE